MINDCLNAITTSKNGKIPSTMILPTLVAQIDGVQREFLLKNNFEVVGTRFKPKVKNGNEPK